LADRGGDRAAYRRAMAEQARREAAQACTVMAQWERSNAAQPVDSGGQNAEDSG
jgi:hypothetical protein